MLKNISLRYVTRWYAISHYVMMHLLERRRSHNHSISRSLQMFALLANTAEHDGKTTAELNDRTITADRAFSIHGGPRGAGSPPRRRTQLQNTLPDCRTQLSITTAEQNPTCGSGGRGRSFFDKSPALAPRLQCQSRPHKPRPKLMPGIGPQTAMPESPPQA